MATTPRGVRHGGNTGHHNGFPGPLAATPNDGRLSGPARPGMRMQGGGFQDGRGLAASPFSGRINRSTGYRGVRGDYAGASPDMGFVTKGNGSFPAGGTPGESRDPGARGYGAR